MKKQVIIAFCPLLLIACGKESGTAPSHPESYQYLTPYTIAEYYDGEMTLEAIKQETPDFIGQRLDDEGIQLIFQDGMLYQDPNLRDEPVNTDKYIECATKNGDVRIGNA